MPRIGWREHGAGILNIWWVHPWFPGRFLPQSIDSWRLPSPHQVVLTVPRRMAFLADASYLLSGGMGALGLVTAQALAEEGAKSLLLMSRSCEGQCLSLWLNWEVYWIYVTNQRWDIELEHILKPCVERGRRSVRTIENLCRCVYKNDGYSKQDSLPAAETGKTTYVYSVRNVYRNTGYVYI